MSYATISVEGGLFPPDLPDRIATDDNSISGQKPADFGLPAGRRLPDEIQRTFSDARVHWDSFTRRLEHSRESRTTLTRQDWASKFFELLSFPTLEYQRTAIEAGGTAFPISYLTGGPDIYTPVHIVAVDQDLDERSGRDAPPHALVQDYLNRSDSLWGMVTNGAKLRLLRDSARLSKPAYLEFDIQAMIEGNAYSEFVALYRLLHASRLPHSGIGPHECLLESYYNQGIEEGGRVREKLRDGVRNALEVLGSALVQHPKSEALREALKGRLNDTTYYRQLLNFVYRMLFLMVTEERRLLFTSGDIRQQAVYDRYYSVTHLRGRAERYFAGDTHSDLWAGLAQTFRLFRDDNAAQQLGLSPLNGELFGRGACRDIESAACANEAFLDAMLSLSTFDDNGVRRRVNYAHLDVEEFGSVYESLLDYRPVVDLGKASGAPPRFQLAAGTERKQTGSYYTPPELVRELVESALVPVMEERLTEAKTAQDKEQALLDLRVCDPASGSGHFLLAAARRIARELARVRGGGDEPAPSEYRAAIRDVVRHCIYAVDKNPLAVDLCKVALWIESHAAGLPLSFLDHHVKCGDSLVGVMDLSVLENGIPNDAYKPVTGDDKNAATGYRKRNQQERKGMRSLGPGRPEVSIREIAEEHAIFSGMEERNTAEVQAKFDLFRQLRGEGTRWLDLKIACDLWTSAFFLPLLPETPAAPQIPTTDTVRKWLESRTVVGTLTGKAAAAAAQGNFFHWPLEFPEVFDEGGFDVVLGNPPWERIKLQEKEFFETRDREIADAPNKAARDRLIRALPQQNPVLARTFALAVHGAESSSRFVRGSNRFSLTGRGDVNTYSIFAETARTIGSPKGRVGMIVPSGIATDDTTKQFFSDLVDKCSLVSLYDFENRDGVFPGVHRSYKFCLLTLSGASRPSPQAEFAFFLHRTEQCQEEVRRFTLTPEDFALFNPNTRTCPVFRTRKDTEITLGVYSRNPVLVDRSGGDERRTWPVHMLRMFDMTNDSHLFLTPDQVNVEGFRPVGLNWWEKNNQRLLPLYEGKMVQAFDHRAADATENPQNMLRKGQQSALVASEKQRLDRFPSPRYFVHDVESRWPTDNDWIVAYKSVTAATNTRTMIAAIIPKAGAGNSLNLLAFDPEVRDVPIQACMVVANLNSIPFDFVARQKIPGVNLNWFLLEQIPFIARAEYEREFGGRTARQLVRDRVLELTYTAWDLQSFAEDLGYDSEPFPWDEERRHRLKCELDAIFAHMYQLDRADLEWILDAPEPSASFPGLKRNELQQFGEYRTQRYVLQAYDQLAQGQLPDLVP